MTPRPLRGKIVYAFTSFVPEAPFEIINPSGSRASYRSTAEILEAIKADELSADTQEYVVAAKLRPVVVLQDRPRGVLREYAALKLTRLNKLSEEARKRVRQQHEPALFFLDHGNARYGLKQDNAVDLNSLVRIHETAILPGQLGELDANEIDVLGRRLAVYLDIDLGAAIREGVLKRFAELAAEQRRRRS